jgi:hypothetical protein
MALGLILIAMFGAASATVFLFVQGFPFWAVALAYPVVGTAILLPGVAFVAWIRINRPVPYGGQLVTSQSPVIQHPRSQVRSSNP